MPYNRYPRERVRAVILEMLAAGIVPGQLNPTQVRLRLGGGTWTIIQEEIAAILAGGAKGQAATDEAEAMLERLVPTELVPLAARVDDALAALRSAVHELVSAVRVRDAQRHESEVSALRFEIERLRAPVAGSDGAPPSEAQPESSNVVRSARRPRR